MMPYHQDPGAPQTGGYYRGGSSPLRYSASNASTNSSAYTAASSASHTPSRTSTMSSHQSSVLSPTGAGHKRGINDMSPTRPPTRDKTPTTNTAAGDYKSIRQSLRPLPQAPGPPPTLSASALQSSNTPKSSQIEPSKRRNHESTCSPTIPKSYLSPPNSSFLSRGGSITPMTSSSARIEQHSHYSSPPNLTSPELTDMKSSSTSHLRTLSKYAQNEVSEDYSIGSPAPSVVGLSGRRQLKRMGSNKKNKGLGKAGSTWAENNWMEKQRQFLQAYEYLCHIGEAKEWIEDIIHQSLPPIVQLEEALRDGVTLAEIVQAFYPDQRMRIFRHHKLQFRHSDNIALFFRFLADMELPELFRFELIDLYEKKNIPKVIHCIHALSWLLYRKGLVDFRIGNLVGQLEFEHHELEEMQKGLDKAGVSMPSFAGMGASFGAEPEPEPEPDPVPVESEEERVARELSLNEQSILDFQSQIRGSIVRMELGDTMQTLWDAEEKLVELQSRIRGSWAREIRNYRLSMRKCAVNVQSAARGFLERRRRRENQLSWKDQDCNVRMLQSMIRARASRTAVLLLKQSIREENPTTCSFQAMVRGALQRKHFDTQRHDTEEASGAVDALQAIGRGFIRRRALGTQNAQLQSAVHSIIGMQSLARASARRQCLALQNRALQTCTNGWRTIQAHSRGLLYRQRLAAFHARLCAHSRPVQTLQAIARGKALRQQKSRLITSLKQHHINLIYLQSMGRARLLRQKLCAETQAIVDQLVPITTLQGLIRGSSLRSDVIDLLDSLAANEEEITALQGLGRAMIVRSEICDILGHLDKKEAAVISTQAAMRGKLVREKFAEKHRYFKANMEKVVKVQSFVRGRLQGEAYKSLTNGVNPPVGTVKGFVHLLNDSDFDFDEEVEFERLRKTVVQHVRQNEMADQYISQLDIKIALLVKNKITLDEVVKHQKHFGSTAGTLLTNGELASKDPFDLKALNKNSRRKLEHYQELFFILQTQPQYLARLFKRLREQGTAEKECERIRHLMMGLFGYAQKRREEYYLIKLIIRSLKEEVDGCASLHDYLRGNFYWQKLFGSYIKSPRDRKFMRDVLGTLIKENIIENPELDLESDPMQIYLSAIENEQLRTGRTSPRSPDIPREAAIRDPETKRTFITHLQDLRDISDQFFLALEEQLHKLPFGVRYIAQQMYSILSIRFPHEEPGHVLQVVGQWIWKNYLNPGMTEPEKYGVIDRGLGQEHRRNIAEVTKVLNQVAAGRLFGSENVFLQPLNSYVGESIERLGETWSHLIDVPNAEAQFDIDEFNDLYARTKPTLYIKMADIFAIHHLVAGDTPAICSARDDILQEVIRELGSVKNNENELMSVSSSEICLTLNPKLHESEDPDAEMKALFMETKRCVLYIIRIQAGADLMDIMVKPITSEDEDRWDILVRDELSAGSRNRGAYAEANTVVDIASMSYAELKRTALEDVLRLEKYGRLSRHNHYQDLLNAIAVDIRTKHRRRIQRQRELETVRMTLARLNDQAMYLEGQLKTYNDYIEQAMVTLQNKKGKKRFLMPFTKQWDHERELARSGRVPKFGSFKYSAQELGNRGILVSWQGYNERQWDKLDLTISSNEVGVFSLEGSNGPISIPGATAQVPLDDLLQAQFNNTQFLEFFSDCRVKVNVNLFVHLIMRKFYKDKDS